MSTAQNIRVFLAISIAQTASPILYRQLLPLRPTLKKYNLRWIPQQNWHITVKFIGALPAGKTPFLAKELTAQLRQLPSFELELKTIDWFPNTVEPIMLAAIPAPCEPLNRLASCLDKTLTHYGIPHNSKPFRAHLSLARHKGAKDTTSQHLPASLSPVKIAVSQVELYQSRLEKQGVYYSKLVSFKLMF